MYKWPHFRKRLVMLESPFSDFPFPIADGSFLFHNRLQLFGWKRIFFPLIRCFLSQWFFPPFQRNVFWIFIFGEKFPSRMGWDFCQVRHMVFDEADTLCDSWPDLDKTLYAISWEKKHHSVQSGTFCEGLVKGLLNLAARTTTQPKPSGRFLRQPTLSPTIMEVENDYFGDSTHLPGPCFPQKLPHGLVKWMDQ